MAVRPPVITGVADVTQSLNVAQTLSQARKVLQSHRHWMKTRTATVTPLEVDEDPEGAPSVRSGWLQAPSNRWATELGGADEERVASPLAAWNVSDIKPTVNESGEENKQFETEKRLSNVSKSLSETASERKRRSKKKKKTSHNSVAPSADLFSESVQRTPIPDVFTVSSHSITSQPLVTRVAWTTSSHSLSSADSTNTTKPVTESLSSNSKNDLHVNQEEISDQEELNGEGDDDRTALRNSNASSRISLRDGNDLHSASTGTVIAIAPAPKHRTTSYRRHKHSKVGSEREPIDSSADDDSKSDQDSPLMTRNNINERQHHSYIADPTLVTVFPKKHQTGARALSIKSKSQNLQPQVSRKDDRMERERSEKRTDEKSGEEKSTSQMPDVKKQEKTAHADVSQSESLSKLHTVSSGDLLVEDAEDENTYFDTTADSLQSPHSPALTTSHELKSAAKFVPMLEDVEEIEDENGEVTGSAHSKDRLHQVAKESSSKFAPRSPSLEKPQVKHKRRKRSKPKQTPVEHLTNDTAAPVDSHVPQTISWEDNEGSSESSQTTEVKLISHDQTENLSTDEEGENSDHRLPPILKVKSTSSLNLPTDFKFTRKRDRNPPPYSLHCSSHAVSIPSCPVYGTIQPSEAELVKAYSKAVSRISPPTFSSPSSQHTELVDEGIQTNLLEDQDNGSTYRDDEFIQQTQSSQLSVSVPDSSLEPGELHLAARDGNLAKIRDLLVKGYDVNGLDGGGYTPLMYCILPEGRGVQLHCADLLIRRGANLDHKAVDGSTALHLASYVGALSLIQLLLFNGANPDVRDSDGRLPLHWATKPLTTKPIAELLKYSASEVNSPDSADMTTLMWAAYHQNVQVLQYLLSRGADVEEKDMDGETAMHWSVHEKETRCLELLLKPDMTYFKDHNGGTVMHKAAKLGCVTAVEIIAALRHDAVHDIDKKGRTPLHYSAVNDKVDVCYALLTKGADATQKDFEGKTPLDYSREQGNEYAVALFTCQENSIADFTRMTRTMSHSSTIARSTSFDNLTNADNNSVIAETLSLDQTSLLDNASLLLDNTLSQEPLTQADIELLSRGSYLGYFPRNSNDPPRHYYFWVYPDKGTVCWSRSDSRRNKKEARVYRVYSSPSLAVTARPDFSPHELHRYAFWLTTDKGVLDLLAYTEEAYKHWIKELQVLAQQNGEEQEQVSIEGSKEYERDEQTDLALPQNDDLLSETSSVFRPSVPVTSTPAHNQTDHKVQPPLDPYQVI